jgi:hypothetical protein
MALSDPPKPRDYPRQWKDMSLELKLMFVYHGCMMVLFFTGDAFSTRQEFGFAAVLLFLLVSLSIRHRRSTGWRWPGVKPKDWLMAVGGVALIGVFLYAATPMFPPWNSRSLPWYLAGFGIGALNALRTLQLVQPSEAAFLADCHEPANQFEQATNSEPTEPIEPKWHRIVRSGYSSVFFLVWLGFLAFFFYSGDGSPVPTLTQMNAVTEHGKTVYLTNDQRILRDNLQLFAFIGIPSVIVGVKLYPNSPTLRELQARKSSSH